LRENVPRSRNLKEQDFMIQEGEETRLERKPWNSKR